MPIIDVVERPTTDARPSRPSIRFRALMQPISQPMVSGTPHQPNSMRQPKTMMKSTENPAEVIEQGGQELQREFRPRAEVAAIIDRPKEAGQGRGRNQHPAQSRQLEVPKSIQPQGRNQPCDQCQVDGNAPQQRHWAGMEPPLQIGIGQHAQPPSQAPHQGCQCQRRGQAPRPSEPASRARCHPFSARLSQNCPTGATPISRNHCRE